MALILGNRPICAALERLQRRTAYRRTRQKLPSGGMTRRAAPARELGRGRSCRSWRCLRQHRARQHAVRQKALAGGHHGLVFAQ